jgi:hypothetical protein
MTMTRLFQFMTAALLGLALIVPASAQEGRRPKDRPRKEKHDVTVVPKSDSRDRNNGDRDRNRDRGDRERNGDERGKGRRGERPNALELDAEDDL